ncbi:MAG TPA: hypothetical protein VGR31_02045 [Planctomycetota bacterium]|jgi:hypothetical protein|nr:hypothetical protein [Planctomycetota bacterium]
MRIARSFVLSAALALAASTAGCASTQSERNLAPLFTEISRGGGGTELELLGGAIRVRRSRPGAPFQQYAVRPFTIVDRTPTGETLSHFLTPFGTGRDAGSEYTWQLLPIARYDRTVQPTGELEWTFISLPGIYWARRADGRTLRAVFPFGGVVEHFLSYDRLVFVLFPIFARTERSGRITYSFLFPVFAFTYGGGGGGWRVWPIYGRSKVEGSYDRTFVLWPIFHWEHNDLWAAPEKQERKWMVFPLVGHTTRDTYHSTTVLWPFFGWARNPKTDFWSWDGPWPLVRLHHDPQTDTFRTRFWPVYSHYHGDGLDSNWYLWPIVNVRSELYPNARKTGLYILPFWQSWTRHDAVAGRSSFRKLWPLGQIERLEEHGMKFAFPALNPLWRTPEIDEMYAWIYEVYTRERDHDILRERSWLGLYRREKDAAEDRSSFVGLWGRRRYGKTTEMSLLFGLLRWRKTPSGSLEWMPPAIPGPGWPLERESTGP